jgi:acyl-coenzyme A thioesterase PaaI-like protein
VTDAEVVVLPPYFTHIGIESQGEGDGLLSFREEIANSGGFIHGGALEALLNFTMLRTLHAIRPGLRCALVTITVNYLAPTKGPVLGTATVDRAGRNVVFMTARATTADKTVATGTAVFQLSERRS